MDVYLNALPAYLEFLSELGLELFNFHSSALFSTKLLQVELHAMLFLHVFDLALVPVKHNYGELEMVTLDHRW